MCSVHVQQIRENISTKSSKIAIHKKFDPRKFSAVQYFICFNCEFYSVNFFSEPDTSCQCSTSPYVHTLISFPATVSRLKGAQAELDKVMAQLKEKQEKLAAIEAKVNIGIAYHMPLSGIAHIPSMAKPFIGIL